MFVIGILPNLRVLLPILFVVSSFASAETTFTSFDASRHLFSGIRVTGELSAPGHQVRILRSLQNDRATAIVVTPSFTLTAPDDSYFNWADPTALANRDYFYWAEALSSGAVVAEAGATIGKRPVDVVDVSQWEQTSPSPGNDFGDHDLRLLSHGGYTYLYGAGNILRRSSDGGETWTEFTTLNVTLTLLVGGEPGVLIGRIGSASGATYRSADAGETWAQIPGVGQGGLPTSISLLAHGANQWLATSGGYVYGSSNSGVSWTNLGQKSGTSFLGLFYGTDRFVAWVGNSDRVHHSVDGNTWSSVDPDPNRGGRVQWIALKGSEYFVAPQVISGIGHPYKVARSSNLTSWTLTGDLTQAQTVAFSSAPPRSVGSFFYGWGNSGQLVRSSDLINWEIVDDNFYTSVIDAGSRLLGAGRGGFLAESPNGQTWIGLTARTNQNILKVLQGTAGWVAVPAFGRPLFSADGRTWQFANQLPAMRSITWRAWAVGDGRFVLYGSHSREVDTFVTNPDGTITFPWNSPKRVTETFFVSTDGINWTEQSYVQEAMNALTRFSSDSPMQFVNGAFYLGSNVNRTFMETSTNGSTWQLLPNSFNPAGSNDTTFRSLFAFNDDVYLTTSRDHIFWGVRAVVNRASEVSGPWTFLTLTGSISPQVIPFGGRMWSRSYAEGSYTISSSTDGTTWTPAPFTKASLAGSGSGWFETSGLGAFFAFPLIITSAGENSAWYPVTANVPITTAAGSATAVVGGGNNGRLYLASLPEVSPPTITSQTESVSVPLGDDASLTVTATGDPVLTYQWYAGASGDTLVPLPSTDPSITLFDVVEDTSAWVRVGNEYGEVDSATIPVTVIPPVPVFESPANTTFTAGVPIVLQLAATFSPTYAATGLPAGLFLNPQTGRISGVTALIGEFSVELTLMNGTYIGEGEFTLHILPAPPIILSPSPIPGKVGVPLQFTIAATGDPSAFSETGLPTGLSIHPTSGLISGTPSAAGIYPATVSATNDGGTTERIIVFEISDHRIRPQISSPSQAAAVQGQPFQYLLSASGTPTAFAIATLPDGLSYDSVIGGIVGTPLAFGRFEVEVRADSNDLQGETTTIELFIEASEDLPRVILPELPLARLGVPFSLILSANLVGSQIHWEPDGTGTLPPGLTLATSGQMTGTPTAPGAYPLKAWATNANGAGPKVNFELFVAAPLDAPSVLAPSSLSGKVGVAFTSQIASTNLAATFTAQDLPPGISLNATSGALTGTPTAPGVFIAAFTATAGGISGPEKLIPFQIAPAQQAPIVLGPATWTVRAGEAFVIPLVTSGEPDGLEVTGLPTGTDALDEGLQIYGTTGETGLHSIEIIPLRGGIQGTPFLLELNVEGSFSSPVISGPQTLTATVGQPFTWSPSIQPAPGDTLAFVTADGLPAGLQIDAATGTLSGTPVRSGEFTVKLQASGSFGSGTPFVVRLEILPSHTVPRILNSPVLELTQGDLVSIQLTAAPGPVSAYGATDLPPGLTIDRVNGIIQGIAREAGAFTTEVFASNPGGTGPRQPLRFIIASALGTPRVTAAYHRHGFEGESVSGRIFATALPTHGLTTPLPDGFGFVVENLPAGLALDPATGFITGALGAPGEYEYRAAAFNQNGMGPWATGQIRILPSPNTARILGPARVIMQQNQAFEVNLLTEGMTAENSIDWLILSNFQVIGTATESVTLISEFFSGSSSLTANLIGSVRRQGTGYRSRSFGRGGYSYTYTYYEPGIVSARSIPVWIEPDQSERPEMTTASIHIGEVGVPFSLEFSATNGPTGYSASGNLPQGLTFSGSGLLGTPQSPGRHTIRIVAFNSFGYGLDKAIDLLISPAAGTPAFTGFGIAAPDGLTVSGLSGYSALSSTHSSTSLSTPDPLQVGVYSSLYLQADADVTRVIVSGLPPGLLHNSTSGEISGIPEVPGDFTVSLRFENIAGPGPETIFTLRVEAAAGTPVLTPPVLPHATAGSPYSANLSATGATAFGGNNLPDFLLLDSATGALSGTPTFPGEHTVTFHAVNENGRSFPVTTTLIVLPAEGAPVLSGSLPFTGAQGVPFEDFLTASPLALVFEIESLPPGLELDPATGRIHGTPATPGLFTTTARASNSVGWSNSTPVILDFDGPPGTPDLVVPEALVIAANSSFSLQIEGESSPLAFEGRDLPSGLTIDAVTGLLSTRGLAPGTYAFTLNGLNDLGTGGSHWITLLAGQPADVWRAEHFGATAVLDPTLEVELWGDLADADRDGRTNLLEYHDGTLPFTPDTPAPGTLELNGEAFSWRTTYTRRDDLIVVPEFSINLGFDPLLPVEVEILHENGDRIEVEYSVTRPPGTSDLFSRLRVQTIAD